MLAAIGQGVRRVRRGPALRLPSDEVLARANDLFFGSSLPATYATLAAAWLRPDGAVDLYSAGHWPPLLRRGRTTAPVTVDGGRPIGLFAGSRYRPTRLTLDAGDTLLFYTDGAVEAERADGDEYGSGRLVRALSGAPDDELPALVETCLDDVRRFVDGRPVTDDLTLFALRAAPVAPEGPE